MPGKKVDSRAGGTVGSGLRNELFHAPPAKTPWSRVLHQVSILALSRARSVYAFPVFASCKSMNYPLILGFYGKKSTISMYVSPSSNIWDNSGSINLNC